MTRRAAVIGSGMYLPQTVLTNDDLAKLVDTSDKWIQSRTGIKNRHKAADNQVTSDLAVEAAKMALDNAGITVDAVDQIIVATTTPDKTLPSTAVYVQGKLGMINGAGFDIQATCTGFVYGLTIANSLISSGVCDTILLIGAETLSRIVDWNDRNTCVLFGDGAAAVVLQVRKGQGTLQDSGILSHHIRSDGRFAEMLTTDSGTSYNQQSGVIYMKGKELFKHVVITLSDSILTILDEVKLTVEDIDWFVPHQANLRIITAVGKRVGLDEDKVIITIDQHANTSAASIPLAFHTGIASGRIKPGDLVIFVAAGSGLTWGATLLRV